MVEPQQDQPAASPRPAPRGIPIRVLIPNLITLLVLAAGLTAVRFAAEGQWDRAVMAIAAGAVLDGLDGRIARLLKGTSPFGAELDSLADFISFGCAPALTLYFWHLKELSTFGWLAALSLAFAMALRLARFNVALADTTKPEWTKQFFTGVPAPAGAMLALLPINLTLSGVPEFTGYAWLIAIYTAGVAGMVVSRLPTLSGKGKSGPIPRDRVIPLVGVVLAVFVLLVSHPFPTLTALSLGYIALLPVGFARYRSLRDADAARTSAP